MSDIFLLENDIYLTDRFVVHCCLLQVRKTLNEIQKIMQVIVYNVSGG